MMRCIWVAALVSAAACAHAQDYPAKPIRIIVPFPPAGATDIVGRVVAADLQKAWGQPVTVENRAGAGGNLGAELVAKAAPDGYTLLVGTVGTHGINSSLYPKLPFDPIKDFEPVSLVALVPNLMVVHPSVPAKTVQEFIAYAKTRPGKIDYASSGNGTSIHLSAELFKSMSGTYLVHIPYRGSGPAVTDLLGGQVAVMFDNLPSALPHVKAGKLRPLGITSLKRSPALPDVPTLSESGLKGFDASSWFGILAPAGTPKPIVDRLQQQIAKGLATTEGRDRLASQGAEPVGNTPTEFAAFIRAEIAKWGTVVKVAGAKLD